MRGEVEIYSGDKLIFHEANMLADGAGTLLADIMTVSPSLSGVADHATSSILDTSNYMVQAISFGTSKKAALNNASRTSQAWWDYTSGTAAPAIATTGIRPLVLHCSTLGNCGSTSFSYTPVVGVPHPPDPTPPVLEPDNNVSGQVPIINSVDYSALTASDLIDVSSVFPGNGQLLNFLPSAIASAMCSSTAFSALPESWYGAASVLGAFPEGSSAPTEMTRYMVFPNESYVVGGHAYTGTYKGIFNEANSMDVSGFVNMVMSSVPHAAYDMSSTFSGLCLSAAPDFANTGIVEYSVTVGSGDVGMSNFYGGIYHLGLWTIDMKNSLLKGNSPPYSFSVLDNPRKYRLFARKGLGKNLCYIEDGANEGHSSYTDLTIKWRLHFL